MNIIWRQGKPETARHYRNWLQREWLGFILGFPFHRVWHLTAPDYSTLSASEIAREWETYIK